MNANYISHQLADDFPTLYTGKNGLVAHECILDLREITKRSGITAEDVSKRLMDFGFHAPTLAFPVPGTLMVEPTESEDKGELDRFIEAMHTIRREIDEVIDGTVAEEDSVIRHAPYTAATTLMRPCPTATSRAKKRHSPFPVCVGPSTSHQFAVLTTPTATATWRARARPWRISPLPTRNSTAWINRHHRQHQPHVPQH